MGCSLGENLTVFLLLFIIILKKCIIFYLFINRN